MIRKSTEALPVKNAVGAAVALLVCRKVGGNELQLSLQRSHDFKMPAGSFKAVDCLGAEWSVDCGGPTFIVNYLNKKITIPVEDHAGNVCCLIKTKGGDLKKVTAYDIKRNVFAVLERFALAVEWTPFVGTDADKAPPPFQETISLLELEAGERVPTKKTALVGATAPIEASDGGAAVGVVNMGAFSAASAGVLEPGDRPGITERARTKDALSKFTREALHLLASEFLGRESAGVLQQSRRVLWEKAVSQGWVKSSMVPTWEVKV